jgi:cullin-associated NEDD8-dissociated protein 1
VRKRAIITISQFIPISQPALFSELLIADVLPNLTASANLEKQRTTVQLVAAVARNSPSQIAPVLSKIVPGILQAVEKSDDELREGSLQVRSIPPAFSIYSPFL